MHFLAATSPLPVTFEFIERFPAKHKSYPQKNTNVVCQQIILFQIMFHLNTLIGSLHDFSSRFLKLPREAEVSKYFRRFNQHSAVPSLLRINSFPMSNNSLTMSGMNLIFIT